MTGDVPGIADLRPSRAQGEGGGVGEHSLQDLLSHYYLQLILLIAPNMHEGDLAP